MVKSIVQNVATALISTVFAFWLFTQYYQQPSSAATSAYPVQLASQTKAKPVNRTPRAWEEAPNFISTSTQVTDGVVNITVYGKSGYKVASGSGVVASRDGYIITNFHVVQNGREYEIAFPDKRVFKGRFVGSDPSTDLALLKVDASDLNPIPFGNSDDVQVGEWVLAVGNPFNLTSTVTAGIVSAKARDINIFRQNYAIESFIQTDAVVNPGNSGGALVNAEGQLIGINTAIITESGGYEGYSFAIPANLVRKVVLDLREFGKVKRAILGVRIREVTAEMAADLGLPSIAGVYITETSPGGSAERAGLRSGDVITRINGQRTNSVPELQEAVALFRPGDSVNVGFYRQGRYLELEDIRLQSLDAVSTIR
jgi:S1-C subfamily serine protease